MDAITFGLYGVFALVFGMAVGWFAAIQAARAGKLAHEGITYSYFNTRKYRMHQAARQSR